VKAVKPAASRNERSPSSIAAPSRKRLVALTAAMICLHARAERDHALTDALSAAMTATPVPEV